MTVDSLKDLGARHLVGTAPVMVDLWSVLQQVGRTAATVLITGETGTGKELVARELHELSPRSKSELVVVNCAELERERAETELFGHVRGAYTGANTDRLGLFRTADGGTLFLDEIGELPTEVQAKLLRAIDRHEVRPVGSDRTHSINVRVIAATNRSIGQSVADGRFRQDLAARFRYQLELPPLRDRLDDLPVLVEHFVRQHREADGHNAKAQGATPEALARLRSHRWPENVRQLENAVCRALVATANSGETSLDAMHFPEPPARSDRLTSVRRRAEVASAEFADAVIDAILSRVLDPASPSDLEKAFPSVRLRDQLVHRFMTRFDGDLAKGNVARVFTVTTMEALRKLVRTSPTTTDGDSSARVPVS